MVSGKTLVKRLGRAAFDAETHAELLGLAAHLSVIELAARYRVHPATVKKWLSLPLGYQPKHGRPRKQNASGESL